MLTLVSQPLTIFGPIGSKGRMQIDGLDNPDDCSAPVRLFLTSLAGLLSVRSRPPRSFKVHSLNRRGRDLVGISGFHR